MVKQTFVALIALFTLVSCAPQINYIRTANAISTFKKGMQINTLDSLGSFNRVAEENKIDKRYRGREANFATDKRIEYKINFENNSYNIIVIGIVNSKREEDKLMDKEKLSTIPGAKYSTGQDPSKNSPFSSQSIVVEREIEDDMFLFFKDDKLVNWVYLYELLNSSKEKDRKLGELLAIEHDKFKNPKREE